MVVDFNFHHDRGEVILGVPVTAHHVGPDIVTPHTEGVEVFQPRAGAIAVGAVVDFQTIDRPIPVAGATAMLVPFESELSHGLELRPVDARIASSHLDAFPIGGGQKSFGVSYHSEAFRTIGIRENVVKG